MKQLIAIRRLRYGTRHLQVGDRFEARDSDARLLMRMKRAVEPARAPVDIAPMPATVEAKLNELAPKSAAPEIQDKPLKPWEAPEPVAPLTLRSPLDQMRDRYQKETGKKPDARWGIARIEKELTGGV
jgi:hypothetical protein